MSLSDDPTITDADLLLAYARNGNQQAFCKLVERHVGLVTGVVRRQVGDAGAAEEAVQNVFSMLARKAGSARARPTLAGWLCRTALFESRRAQRRAALSIRRLHELMNHIHSLTPDTQDPRWSEALPFLDQAMAELSAADRDLLLLRFHERKSFQLIGDTLGKSADASQKQSERALEKLGNLLRRKGITLGVVAIAAGLGATLSAKPSSPPCNSSQLATQAVSNAPNIGRLTLIHHTLETMNHPKTTTFIATLLLAVLPLGLLWRENKALRETLAAASDRSPSLPTRQPGATTGPRTGGSAPGLANGLMQDTIAPIDWTQLTSDKDPVRRSNQFHHFLATLTPDAARIASATLTELRNGNKLTADEWKLFLRAWAGVDGNTALAYLSSLPENSVARSGGEREAALAGWAGQDTAAAQAWISQELAAMQTPSGGPNPYVMEELINAVSGGMRLNNPAAARNYLIAQAVAGSVNPARAAHWAVGDINDDPPGTAASLIATLPTDGSHDEIRKALLGATLVNRRTDESIALAVQYQEFLEPESLRSVSSYVSDTGATEAMTWLDSLEKVAPDKKGLARAQVITNWASTDPDAAGAWLSQTNRRTDPAYADTAAAYSQAVVGYDPTAAIAWAKTLPDAEAQHATLVAMARSSQGRKDTEAVALLMAQGLTDEDLKQSQVLNLGDDMITFSGRINDTVTLNVRDFNINGYAFAQKRHVVISESSNEAAASRTRRPLPLPPQP